MAGSGLRPLSNIPHCCLPQESGPCLSPSEADHPLRPATDRRLGEPLPHQLANQTRADPSAINLSPYGLCRYYPKFPWVVPNRRVRSHVLLSRLPLPLRGARLACVKPAASVRSEPGSNSQVQLRSCPDWSLRRSPYARVAYSTSSKHIRPDLNPLDRLTTFIGIK